MGIVGLCAGVVLAVLLNVVNVHLKVVRWGVLLEVRGSLGLFGGASALCEAVLRAWYEAHRDRYRAAPHLDLEQRFFSADRRGARASAEASRALSTGDPGDPFLRGGRFDDVTIVELAGVFGEGFAAAVEALSVGPWSGPIRSALGQHLVRVTAKRDGSVAPFEAARETVAREWREAERARRVEAATRALLDGFRVVRE